MSRDDALRSALERLPFAVLVVDGAQMLLPYNRRAIEFFNAESLREDLLKSRQSHPLSAFVEELRTADASRSLDERTIAFPSGHRYRIEPSRRSEKGSGRWLMLLISPADSSPIDEEAALDGWEFTPRERALAQSLIRGLSTDEICNVLDIAHNTLKTHMRQVLEKTASRTRAECVAKLLRER